MIYQVLETDYANRVGINFRTHSYEYGFKYAYFEFTENGYKQYNEKYIVENSDGYNYIGDNQIRNVSERKFKNWEKITPIITDIQNDEYVKFGLSTELSVRYFSPILVKKNDSIEIEEIYKNRNNERKWMKYNLSSFVDANILEMAENLLNIIEEDVLLNWRIVTACQLKYSFLEISIPEHVECWYDKNPIISEILRVHTNGLKGKKKVEAEKQESRIKEQYSNLIKIIDNFIEVVSEEKELKLYAAEAVAWETIQRKTIEYYGQIWQCDYDTQLERNFDELYEQDIDKNKIAKEYIKEVLLSDAIDADSSCEILMYFLLYKANKINMVNLSKMFSSFYANLREIKEEINSTDIKIKLKTKQKRKISKYTIDDVDIMTGSEFEEFVGQLFKRMGYSSQVTKKSGDQGLDVIAVKRGTKVGIQTKCYSNTVGNSAIQEAVAGKSFYGCDKVIVITNNYFTSAAIELAQSNNVILWNRDMLKEKIKELM